LSKEFAPHAAGLVGAILSERFTDGGRILSLRKALGVFSAIWVVVFTLSTTVSLLPKWECASSVFCFSLLFAFFFFLLSAQLSSGRLARHRAVSIGFGFRSSSVSLSFSWVMEESEEDGVAQKAARSKG